MSSPFVSEIKIFSFNFAPKGWTMCNGQLLPINQNSALFSLLGTTYGGDGRITFGLPNLQGRTPTHFGNGQTLGERAGEQSHTLATSEIPLHTHLWSATNVAANQAGPTSNILGGAPEYSNLVTSLVTMYPGQLSTVGGNQSHPNMQPFLTLNFCISLSGIFPSQN
jgi:microcystin-dependent protein